MAWYSLYRWFNTFRRKPFFDWISWYKQFLYDEWFSALSEQEQLAELKQQRETKERRRAKTLETLAALNIAYEMTNEMYKMSHSIKDGILNDIYKSL